MAAAALEVAEVQLQDMNEAERDAAVPVPEPTPVAVNKVLTVLEGAPISVKSVVPLELI